MERLQESGLIEIIPLASYLYRASNLFFSILNALGVHCWGSGWWLGGGSLFVSTLSSFKAHLWGRAAVWLLVWWLKHILFTHMASDIFHAQEHLLRVWRHQNSYPFRILKNVEMVVSCAMCKLLRETHFLGTKLGEKKKKKTVRKTERHKEREKEPATSKELDEG